MKYILFLLAIVCCCIGCHSKEARHTAIAPTTAAIAQPLTSSDTTTISFASFKQISLEPPVLLARIPAKLMMEIPVNPVLIHRVFFPRYEVKDTFDVVNCYRLNKKLDLVHRVATMSYRLLQENAGDTLVINQQIFPVKNILFENLEVVVKRVWKYKQDNREYLVLQIMNNGSGQIHWYRIAIFDVTNPDKVICLNLTSHVTGHSWLSGENVFTDLDHDSKMEINLQDVDAGLSVTAYVIKGDSLVKNGKQLILQQVDNDSFNIVMKQSSWYFDLMKTKPVTPCSFEISEDIFDIKYERGWE